MNTTPVVSFLITCYNEPAEIISKSLRSILMEKKIPVEVVLVNDYPDLPYTPPSDIENDLRFVYLRNDLNLGLTKSLNKGLAVCTGKYIARLDSDDFCLPNRVIEQVNFLNSHLEYGFCGTRYEEIYPNGRIVEPTISRKLSHESFAELLLTENPMAHSTLMVRSDSIKSIGGYDTDIRFAQDYDLYLRLIEAGYKACVIDFLTVQRTWRLNSISFSKAKAQRWIAVKCSLKAAKMFGFSAPFFKQILKNMVFLATPMFLLKNRLKKHLAN